MNPTCLLLLFLSCFFQQANCETECPPGFFTPANATRKCSKCYIYCYRDKAAIKISLSITELNNSTSYNSSSPLFIGRMFFYLDRTKGMLSNKYYRELPNVSSELDGFFVITVIDMDFFVLIASQDVELLPIHTMAYLVLVIVIVMELHSIFYLKLYFLHCSLE